MGNETQYWEENEMDWVEVVVLLVAVVALPVIAAHVIEFGQEATGDDDEYF